MEFAAFARRADEIETADADLAITAKVAAALQAADAELPIVARFLQGRIFPGHDGRKLSIGSTLLHETIARAAGVSASEVETRLAETGEIGAVAAAFDFRDGGQTGLGAFAGGGVDPLTVREVFDAFVDIAEAEGAGSESVRRDTLFGLFTRASPVEAKYLARLVNSTMRIGVGSGTVRDAIAEAFLGVPVSDGADTSGANGADDNDTDDGVSGADDNDTDDGVSGADHPDKTTIADTAMADETDDRADTARDGTTTPTQEKAGGATAGSESGDEAALSVVARALQVTNDYGRVAEIARESGLGGLRELGLSVGRPVQTMLAQAGGGTEAIESWGSAVVDTKFDGARVQLHYDGTEVSIFSRRMEEVTEALPEIVDHAKHELSGPAIIDGECVAIDDDGEPLPFQEILRRFRRKHEIDRMKQEVAVELHAFDCLHADGDDLLDTPLVDRRERLAAVLASGVADWELVTEPTELARIEREALAAGHEGVMVKNPQSTYTPGSRGGDWLKRKPDVETLDLVVVGAEWGEGRRASLFGTYVIAARVPESDDPDTATASDGPDTTTARGKSDTTTARGESDTTTASEEQREDPTGVSLPDDSEYGEITGAGGRFRAVGKVATGFTDEDLAAVTELIEPHVREESGTEVRVDPAVVFEVGYEEIQQSPSYAAGYALRFPRFLGVRDDLDPADADSVTRVSRLAEERHTDERETDE